MHLLKQQERVRQERSSVVNDNSKTAEERANKLSEGVAKFKI